MRKESKNNRETKDHRLAAKDFFRFPTCLRNYIRDEIKASGSSSSNSIRGLAKRLAKSKSITMHQTIYEKRQLLAPVAAAESALPFCCQNGY